MYYYELSDTGKLEYKCNYISAPFVYASLMPIASRIWQEVICNNMCYIFVFDADKNTFIDLSEEMREEFCVVKMSSKVLT